jgi:hypothetical protein
MNNKFRIKAPMSQVGIDKSTEIEQFAKAGEKRDPYYSNIVTEKEKLTKSFTIPLNENELDMLRRSAQKDNRSQRYIARQLLVDAMKKYLNQ